MSYNLTDITDDERAELAVRLAAHILLRKKSDRVKQKDLEAYAVRVDDALLRVIVEDALENLIRDGHLVRTADGKIDLPKVAA